jgi:fucose permease
MQALHFFFGLGAFVAPLIAEPFLSYPNSTLVFSLNSTTTEFPETKNFLTTTPHGPLMGRVIPLSGRDIGHHALNSVFRRDVSDTNLHKTFATAANHSLTDINVHAMTKKPKKPSVANGKFLASDPKVADGKNLKALHDVNNAPVAPYIDSSKNENSHSVSAHGPRPNLVENVKTVPPGGHNVNPVVQKRVEEPANKDSGSILNGTTPSLMSNATLPPPPRTTLKPKPKKPLTDGRILSSDKDVAAGKNVPKKLVETVQKGLKKPVTKPPPVVPTMTVKSNITGSNSTVSPINSTTQGVPKSYSSTTQIVTTRSTTVQTTTVRATTTSAATPVITVLSSSPSSYVTNKVIDDDNSKINSDWKSLKPTATVINSTEADSFLTRVKTQVKKTWHYFTTQITKVQFVYLIVSIFLVVVAMMFCGVCCCLDRRNNGPITRNYNLHHLQQRDGVGFKVQIIILLFLFNFVYVGMEVTYGGFVMSFAVDYLKWEKSDGTYVNALFWGSFALTRLLSIVVAKCLRPTVMLIIDLLITCVSLLALLLTVNSNDLSMWVCTALLGIGMASFFPTMLSWAERYINMTGKITATLIVGAALGEMFMPTLTGFLFEAKTPMFLIYILFASSLFCCVIYIILQNLASNRGEKYSLLASIPVEDDGEDIEMDHVDLTNINANSNHVTKSNNHIGNNSSSRPTKKVTFSLEDDVQLLQDSSASGE